MRVYLISFGAGHLVGIVYSLLGVRSPAPPIIGLVGLGGILIGEQILPLGRHLTERQTSISSFLKREVTPHVLGPLPVGETKASNMDTHPRRGPHAS